ncbi:MAG: polymer-forming cytoskeletal protein [Lachnospiraceae bacterium]|nr:polymer-forming cytoskeletal protein [Lachnospiraceae bacterium]
MFFKDDNKVRVNQTSISTFIGADTKLEGTLITRSSVRIDGTIVGGVVADGTVVLSQSGQIQGNVMAENIVVAGVIDGNLTIKDKTNIEPTGEVYGDINTMRILIDEQSVFQGKCNMNVDRSKSMKGRLKLKETTTTHSEIRSQSESKASEVKAAVEGKAVTASDVKAVGESKADNGSEQKESTSK